MRLLITNKQDNEQHTVEFPSFTDARHWIINHLDTSKQWQGQDITPASRIMSNSPLDEESYFG